eukprot:TRINITY_DN3341_c0_g1_i1.p1 TRINITY_DN3341_c0_g1~~TRINITY_DN3341_c0_g1_i1.p1  ORF type:complete len:272 (+),score=36.93 TRINITY_DN3341_c0_g1_i1:169-984(+)
MPPRNTQITVEGSAVQGDFKPVKKSCVCEFCKETFPETEIRTHLLAEIPKQTQQETGSKTTYFLIKVVGKPCYLYLLVDKKSKFIAVDSLLKDIWLECCGHLSAFSLMDGSGRRRMLEPDEEDQIMAKPLESELQVGSSFHHIYDFGTSTETDGCVMQEIELPKPLQCVRANHCFLVARNEMKQVNCNVCKNSGKKRKAEWTCYNYRCPSAVGSGNRKKPCGLCDECKDAHGCEDYEIHGIANSPREGMCGYEPNGDYVLVGTKRKRSSSS